MPTTVHFSTKDRILGAAEELFAQYGFAGTSLRQVTSRADVNIAAVNYHFGSKENLVNEVFRRRMDEMSAQRLQRLRAAVAGNPCELEHVLAAFVEPALALAGGDDGLDAVRTILRKAPQFMQPDALLIVEVGDNRAGTEAAFPRMPFTWLATPSSEASVFLLRREEIVAGR